MIHLGTLGRMIGIDCPSRQQVSLASRYSLDTTLEGRVKAGARPVGRREWTLDLPSSTAPQETSKLQDFVSGAWGPGPFIFVSAEAPVTNLLTPAVSEGRESQPTPASTLATNPEYAVQPGGPVKLSDGTWAPASLTIHPSYGTINFNIDIVPCLPDQEVTVSAWVRGEGASLRLYWYDSSGTFMAFTGTTGGSSAGWFSRLSRTQMPPQGAAGVRVGVVSAVAATRPAITWTPSAEPWTTGRGCPKSVVRDFSSSLTLVSRGGTMESNSFTVSEVG